jgi:hypothetical protein
LQQFDLGIEGQVWFGVGKHAKAPRKDDQPVPERAEGLVLLLTVYPEARVATNGESGLWMSGEEHPGGEGGHQGGDGGVEDLPGSGAGEEAGEFAGAEAECGEPGEAGGDGAQAVEPAAVGAALVGEGAEQDDRVQVDVRVEKVKARQVRTTLRRAMGVWSVGVIRRPGLSARLAARNAYV